MKVTSCILENIINDVISSDVDLSSFEKKKHLNDGIWDGKKIYPRIRLRLMDIADDFWDSMNLSVKPIDYILAGSICNYNWSDFSDIDLHIIIDFKKIDCDASILKEFFDGKKNQWNNEHSKLTIEGFPVELYVQDSAEANLSSNGIYSLMKDKWLSIPNPSAIRNVGNRSKKIKKISAAIMTEIDILEKKSKSKDLHVVGIVMEKLKKMSKKLKYMRNFGLKRSGESDSLNIVYKVLRRTGYLDKIWNTTDFCYDKVNSLSNRKK